MTPPKPYREFAELLKYLGSETHPQRSVAVLTFNYDLAADFALFQKSLAFDYCLGPWVGSGIPLLKLHGSLNWAVCSKCEEVFPWTLKEFLRTLHQPPGSDFLLDVWSNFGKLYHPQCNTPVQALPFLVPPTWNKTDHQETIRAVWRRAAQELTRAEHIFIIGYSLPETDSFFRTLYALGVVGDMPLKQIWVFNPDASAEQRFRKLMGPGAEAQFQYFPKTFEDAIRSIKAQFPGSR